MRVRDIAYAPDNGRRGTLDVYYGAEWGCSPLDGVAPDEGPRPVFLYVHGGAWAVSQKGHQGLALLNHLAKRGWIGVTCNYRLSPRATFPDHLIDVKRALAWVRQNIAGFGGDPDFVVIGGGSAGGHLASLAALTANDRGYQPGFEEIDTAVQGCVALYSVFDLTDRHRHWPHRGMQLWVERLVIKQKLKDAPGVFEAASPYDHLKPGAPPFLVIHGTHDAMVPPAESRAFVKRYGQVVGDGAVLAMVEGAQHAFDVFVSRRSLVVNEAIVRYVDGLWRRCDAMPRLLANTPHLTLVRSGSDDALQNALETGRVRR